MLKRNLFLINCWLVFIALAALGETVSLYQEWTQAPSIVISLSSLGKASENLTQTSQDFLVRNSSSATYKEQQTIFQKQSIEAEIALVEKKLRKKSKPVLMAQHHSSKKILIHKKALIVVKEAKKDEPPAVTTQSNTDEDSNDTEVFAINNDSPVEAAAFKVDKPKITKVANLFIPLAELKPAKLVVDSKKLKQVEEIKEIDDTDDAEEVALVSEKKDEALNLPMKAIKTEDAVAVGQAAPVKVDPSNQSLDSDEPTFIDYSIDAPIRAIPTKVKMSATVENVIARELKQIPQSIKTPRVEPNEDLTKDTQMPVSTQKPVAIVGASQSAKLFSSDQSSKMSTQNKEAKLRLTALKVELNQGKGKQLQNFEYELAYDASERLYDQGSGEVNWATSLHSHLAVIDGRVVHKDTIRTRSALPISEGLLEAEIPTFSIDSFEKFLAQEKLKGEGGFLLIDVQNNVQQTLLDADFEKSFFLDTNFVKTANVQEARYHLYVGVAPGNVLVNYLLKDGKQAQRVLFVGLDEMTFDPAEFIAERVKKVALYEQKLFGSELSDLQLNPSEVRYFNTKNTAQLQGLNFYEITRPTLPLGMREYLEVGTKRDALFVGGWESSKLEVPALDFRDAVLNAQGLSELGASCLVQLNFSKKIKDIHVSAEAGGGPMNISQTYLGRSGEFSTDYDETTARAFFMGSEQGVINYRVNYLDDTSDTFQSYCSLGSYLVEQL